MLALFSLIQDLYFTSLLNQLGGKLRYSGCLIYSGLWECFKAKLKELEFPSGQYGLHSLHSGGATAAANSVVPDRLFKMAI